MGAEVALRRGLESSQSQLSAQPTRPAFGNFESHARLLHSRRDRHPARSELCPLRGERAHLADDRIRPLARRERLCDDAIAPVVRAAPPTSAGFGDRMGSLGEALFQPAALVAVAVASMRRAAQRRLLLVAEGLAEREQRR
jgi:hypothetical protein